MIPKDAEPISEDAVRRIARIMGDASAATKALADADEKRKAGLDPLFVWSRSARAYFVIAGRWL